MKIIPFVVLALGLISVACATPPAAPKPATVPSPAVTAKTGTIRISLVTVDTGDIPTLMAIDLLKAEGYTVEPIQFANTELQTTALAGGEIDIGRGSTVTHWVATSKGARIRTIMESAANDWFLMTKPEIKTCANLQGRRLAITSAGAVNATLAKAYIQENCPGTTTETLLIADSASRAAALVAGELDATLLKLGDTIELERIAPGRFYTLANFAQDLRALKTTGVYVNTDFAKQYPERVRDVIRAVLTAHRLVSQDPTVLTRALMDTMKFDAARARTTGKTYLDQNIFDVNGGMTVQDIQYTIDFFTKSGSLPPGLKPADVADLSYLDAVLSEMGRK